MSVEEILTNLRDCWCEALSTHPLGAPESCCLVTNVVVADCCAGFAWVRLIGAYPATKFPAQDGSAQKCRPDIWALQVELGVTRCAPEQCGSTGNPCCDSELEGVILGSVEDFQRMRQVFACCLNVPSDEVVLGRFSTADPSGGCITSTMQATIRTTDHCGCP